MSTWRAVVAQQVDIAADAVGRVTVMADTICTTGCLDVKTLGVDGRCRSTGSGNGSLLCLGNLVQADDEDDPLGSPRNGSHTIAVAVNIDNDAVLGNRVGTGQIDIGAKGAEIHLLLLFRSIDSVAVEDVERTSFLQNLRDTQVAHSSRTAPSNGAAVGNEFGDFPDGFSAGRTITGLDVSTTQVLDKSLGQFLVAFFLWCHGEFLFKIRLQI